MPRSRFVLVVGVTLLLIPLAVAYLSGVMEEFIYDGAWRTMLLSPTIVIYILALQGPLGEYQRRAIEVFRPLVKLEDAAFDRLVREASKIDSRAETVGFVLGALFGFVANGPWAINTTSILLKYYFPFSGALMFGMLGWLIVAVVASTDIQATLHQQPLDVDVFDLRRFEPIGRYRLYEALAFVGGSAISVLFINPFTAGLNLFAVVFYAFLGLVALLVFFLGMRHTHRVLAEAKAREMHEVRSNIARVLRRLGGAEEGSFGNISTELNLWLKYEERLQSARTWPYNTAMLRTLVLSALIPLLASLFQRYVFGLLFD